MYSIRSISKRLKSTLLLLLFSGSILWIAATDKESLYLRNEWNNILCEEWNIWLDSCENEHEKEMMLSAFSELEKVMEKGCVTSEFRLDSFDADVFQSMYSTPDFPDSGYRLIAGYVSGQENGHIQTFDSVVLGIVVQEDGTYKVYNNHAKNIFAGMLEGSGVKFRKAAYTEENRSNSLKEAWGSEGDLGELKDCIFISYEEYDNISIFFKTSFRNVCRKMKEWQDTYDVTLNQTARIGELTSDWDTDFTYHASFYPEHELDFDLLATDEEALEQLLEDIKEEQLAYFEQVEPERYEAVLNGEYISRADYRKKYIVPYGRHSTVYDEQYQSMGYRGGEWKGMSQNSERYSAFLEELIRNGGIAKKNIDMEFPDYQFSSGEKEDIITKAVDDNQYGVRWKAEYNDNYCVRYPSGFQYGSSDVCADMIFYEYDTDDKPYPGYTTDTELKENRTYDKGRLYLFAVPEVLSDERSSGKSFLQYIQQGNLNERIRNILSEPIAWKPPGNCQSIYHDFSYAEGESDLRKIAIYIPKMRENENFQWVLLFEEFKDSTLSDTLYHNKELIVQNFIIFPYWYECKSGDTLWGIANQYTNTWNFWNPERKIKELCESPLNQIKNPDLIVPGQRIFIAPHLFLR